MYETYLGNSITIFIKFKKSEASLLFISYFLQTRDIVVRRNQRYLNSPVSKYDKQQMAFFYDAI